MESFLFGQGRLLRAAWVQDTLFLQGADGRSGDHQGDFFAVEHKGFLL